MDLVHGATQAGPPRTHQPAAAMWPSCGRGLGQPVGCYTFAKAPYSFLKSTRNPPSIENNSTYAPRFSVFATAVSQKRWSVLIIAGGPRRRVALNRRPRSSSFSLRATFPCTAWLAVAAEPNEDGEQVRWDPPPSRRPIHLYMSGGCIIGQKPQTIIFNIEWIIIVVCYFFRTQILQIPLSTVNVY